MTWRGKSTILRFLRQTKGAAAVEFAVISIVFVMLIAGVLDFGHAWYLKQIITNASREGARYGITYQTDTNGARIAPSALNPTIQNYVLNTSTQNGNKGGFGLLTILPSNVTPAVPTPAGAGYTTGTKGANLEVTVTAVKTWFMVSSFIPGLGSTRTLTAKSVMLCE
jgi:Flp pilus assembly protein TadG